jgi:hypothetical protein
MQLARTTRLIFTFYKNFAFASLLATSLCIFLFWEYGYTVIGGIFWFRLAVAAVIFYFINLYKEKEYYYYQNLGFSKKLLWITTIVFDFALFIFLLTQIHHFK